MQWFNINLNVYKRDRSLSVCVLIQLAKMR